MMNVAREPMPQPACRPQRRVRGARKTARRLACSSVVLGVAAHLVSAPAACAHDTPSPGKTLARGTAAVTALGVVPSLPPLSEPALLLPLLDANAATPRASATGEPSEAAAKPAPGAAIAAAPVVPADGAAAPGAEGEACESDCPPKRKSPISLLPDLILRNINEVPLLAAMILPVTEGVTITPAEGLPAVTFTVKPTKITRGSGLVAVSRF